MKLPFKCLFVALVVVASPAAAVPPDFSRQADQLVEQAYPAAAPGAAVIVTEHGKIVYEHGRGLADLQAKKPITPETVFRIGSISKQFAAAVILQLAHEGKLSLDDPLSKFFPDYPQPGASATVRQLLSHTSGIQDYTQIPGWMVEANTNRPYATRQLMDVFKNKPPQFKPGEKWAYDNSGYILIGGIIEQVTGKPWYWVVHERIAKPLHLTTLSYGVDEPKIANMALGYRPDGGSGFKPAETINMSVPGAAGALVGTVRDLAAWGNALHHGKVLDAASYKSMITKTKTADGKLNPYGFGMGIREIRGHPTIGHGGGIFGFATASIYVPEQDVFVAVFSNSAPAVTAPETVADKLAMLAIGDPFPKPPEVPRATLQRYAGSYSVGGDVAVVMLGPDGLSVKVGLQPTFPLSARSTTEFEVEQVGARVVFNGAESAPATSMTIHQDGQTIEAPRKD